ncbi:MAG: ABC transporter permease [Rhodanobacter sp.]
MNSSLFPRAVRYYTLWRTLVAQDLAVRYRGTLLGRVWPVLMPLLMLAMYGFVFGIVFRARWPGLAEGDHFGYALNLFVGLLVHTLLAESVGQSATLFQSNSNFVRKVVFPLPVLVAVPLGASLFHMMLGLGLVAVAAVFWGTGLQWLILAVPLILLPYLVMLYGLALALSALGVYVRDLGPILSVAVTMLLFTSTVFFPRSAVPPVLAPIVRVNPISWPVDALRDIILRGQWPSLTDGLHYSLAAVIVLVCGVLIFRALRPGFADVL